jgi:hypothetical protein
MYLDPALTLPRTGSAKTATGNGTAISAAGPGGGALLGGLGRRALAGADPPTGNIAASLNPPGPNCTEQVVEPNGKGGGAISQVSRSSTGMVSRYRPQL